MKLLGDVENVAEDAATAADEGDLDVRVTEAIEEAQNALERAAEMAAGSES